MLGRMLMSTREFRVSVPALLFDPAMFVFDFPPNIEFTKFLVVDESMLDRAPFTDIRFEPLAKAHFWVKTSDLFALEARHDLPRPQPAFIFHHAFVCSTLLARCLGRIGAFFSLKEPWILRRLADHKRANRGLAASPRWRELTCNYLQLLCRNFATGRSPVIKATNVANNLLGDVLRFMPESPVLYLHSDLESFLLSNLKKPADTRQKIPGLLQDALGDCDFLKQHAELRDTSRLGFLQACALLWLVSHYNYRESTSPHPHARTRTLDLKEFLGDPFRTLALVSRHFGHAPDAADVQRMTEAEVMRTNAKDQSTPYGIEQRQSEMDQLRKRHDRDVKEATAWIEPLSGRLGLQEYLHSHRLGGG
jgi:hypothetical protein